MCQINTRKGFEKKLNLPHSVIFKNSIFILKSNQSFECLPKLTCKQRIKFSLSFMEVMIQNIKEVFTLIHTNIPPET